MPAFVQQTNVFNTTGGVYAPTITPAANGLLFGISVYTGGTPRASSVSDNQTGGTYTKLLTVVKATSADTMELFVRDNLCSSVLHTVTRADPPGSDTGGGLVVMEFSGFSAGGSVVFRQYGKQDNQAAATPAPALPVACLTADATIGAVFNATNATTTFTPPTGWTEQAELAYNTPATGFEVVTRDSGFTGTTVTWGSSAVSAFGSFIAELIANAAPVISAPTSIGNATPGTAGATTIALTTTGAVPSGAKILVAVGWNGATTLSSVTATGCSGAIEAQVQQSSENIGLAYLDAPSGLASGATITATFSASSASRYLQAVYITGAKTGAGFGAKTAGQAAAQEWATGNLTSTPAAGDFVWCASYNGSGTTTPNNEPSYGLKENADQNIATDSATVSCWRYAGGAALEGRGWWNTSAPLASAAVAYTVPAGAAAASLIARRRALATVRR